MTQSEASISSTLRGTVAAIKATGGRGERLSGVTAVSYSS